MNNDARDKLQLGDIDGWVAALAAGVKKAPTDPAARIAFGQALMIAGDLERADNQFDLVSGQDPAWAPRVALLRQLIRGLTARKEFFEARRAPEVLKDPGEYMAALLKANVALQDGEAAAALFAEAEALRPAAPGQIDERDFDDCRDLDDRTAGVIELITSTGKYYWVEIAHVNSIVYQQPTNVLETTLMRVEMDVADGPSGVVYLPATYWSAGGEMTAEMRLGRMSDWKEGAGGAVVGFGRRCLLLGEEVSALGEGGALTFSGAVA